MTEDTPEKKEQPRGTCKMEDLQLDHRNKLQTVNLVSPKQMHESFLEKPSLSYIALIAKAILSSPTSKLNLGSIYKYIEDNFPFYKNQGQGWRNSVRHNLSLNDCFIKVGRCEDGKGNYWSIHPANVNDFLQGDYRQHRRSRKHGCRKNMESYLGVSYLPPWRTNPCYLQPEALFRTHPYFMEPVCKMLYVSSTACKQYFSYDYQKWITSYNLTARKFSPAIHSEEAIGNCFNWCHRSYSSATDQNIFLNAQQILPNSIFFPFRMADKIFIQQITH